MKPTRKSVREIARRPGLCSIRLKVVEKKKGHSLVETPLRYEVITFQDDEGTKLRCVLYNEEGEMYKDVIEDRMVYEICNPTVVALLEENCKNVDDQVYELSFNKLTVIRPILDAELACEEAYRFIASIPRSISMGSRYDVLGIVIHVDPNCQVPRSNGLFWNVCEVVIVDQSSEQMLTITTWEGMAIEECRNLQSIITPFPIVAFKSLRPSSWKGFSLSTTHSTVVNSRSFGRKASLLHIWGQSHQDLLAAKKQQALDVQFPVAERHIIILSQLLRKKVSDTLQEERHWIKVDVDELDLSKVELYLGWSNCSKLNDRSKGVTYTCPSCCKQDVVSSPRLHVPFWVADAGATCLLIASNDNAESLLDVDATTLYSMSQQERDYYVPQVENYVKDNPLYIQVKPSLALARYRSLSWNVHKITRV